MELMQRRRELLMMQSELPSVYRQVEYLEGIGAQYIDTQMPISIVSSLSTDWEMKFAITSFQRTQIIAGTYYDLKQIPILNNRIRMDWAASTNNNYFTEIMTENTVYELTQNNGNLLFCGESKAIYATSTRNVPFGLFAKLQDDSSPEKTTIASMRLYSFTAKANGTFIMKMIPCVRKSDNKPGMYDTVSKTFFTNAGTGEFVVPA